MATMLARALPTRVPSASHRSWSPPLMSVRVFSQATEAPTAAPKAALMIIGDEVLSGSIADVNTPWLAKLLHSRGVDLIRVEVIGDDIENIGNTCLSLRNRVGPDGFVFTSGGIGPTHDDVTYLSIAASLGLSLERHAPTVELMKTHYFARGIDLNESRLRMALLPTPSEVLVTTGLWVPLVVAGGNVHILPGIPRLFQSMIEANISRFQGPASFALELHTSTGEGDVASPLAGIAAAFPNVRIGSYPNTQFDLNGPESKLAYRVKLRFEGRDAAMVSAAAEAAQAAIPDTSPAPEEV